MEKKFPGWHWSLVGPTITFVFLLLVSCPQGAMAQSNTFPASGNVGIGTTGPDRRLDVLDSSGPQFRLTHTDGSVYTDFQVFNTGQLVITPSGVDVTMAKPLSVSTTADAFRFFPTSSDNLRWAIGTDSSGLFNVVQRGDSWADEGTRLTINRSGNVGIGTTAPKTKLHVDNSGIANFTGSTAGPFSVSGNGVNYFVPIDFRNTDSATYPYPVARIAMQFTNSGSNLLFGTSNSYGSGVTNTAMAIDYTGNVGIGTTNPIYSLDVNGGVNGFRAKAATVSSSDTIATFENSSGIQAIVRGNGNIGIGTTNPGAKLEVVGNINVTGTGNITASGTITGGTINAKYQDVAEWVESSQSLAAGTVVVLDHNRSNQVIASSQAYDTRVAGVISAQPGIALGERAENKVLVATTGRVKVKVDASAGAIQVGDLLVSSDIEGVAIKSKPIDIAGVELHRPGTIIGKALEPLAKGRGEILVLLSLQ